MFEANPVLTRTTKQVGSGTLTFDGVTHRTGFLLVLTTLAACLTWRGLDSGALSPMIVMAGGLVGLGLGLYVSFSGSCNPVPICLYAVAEGCALGGISNWANASYPGIALQAAGLTFACFTSILVLYSMRVVRYSPALGRFLMIAILGIGGLYLVDLVSGLFGHPLAFIRGNGNVSIAISGVIVLVASLSFIADFAAVEEAVKEGADERQGWRLGFGLLVGLVWLYIEMLRLLMKLAGRQRQ